MIPSEFLHVAWESIRKNKLRALLTMLGIIIGVASVIIMIAVSAGTEAAIEKQITGLGSNLVFVNAAFTRGGFRPEANSGGLVYDDAAAIAQKVPGVEGVVVEQNASATVRAGDVTLNDVTILGTTSDFPSVRSVTVDSGRYFNQRDVDRTTKAAVLGAGLAEQLFGTSDPIGQTISAGNVKLTVIGVLAKRGTVGNVDFDSQVYVPITVVFQRFRPAEFARFVGDRVRTIYVKLQNGAKVSDVTQQIQLLLAHRHNVSLDSADFTVTTQQDVIQAREATTASFRSLLAWVAGVSLIVGGIGIMNIMLVSVTERIREIGIRQAVGASPRDIRWQFLTEALLLSLVGGVIGILAGVIGAVVFGAVGDMPTVVVPGSILLAFASAAAVGAFFGFYPANQAAQLDPIEALRHE
jgi:putative ABC transport system permease protein